MNEKSEAISAQRETSVNDEPDECPSMIPRESG
jgi:hypothetical protein